MTDLHHRLAGQALRYGIAGVAVAALYAGTLLAAALLLDVPAQVANAIGFLTALVAGYLVHSSWSFKDHGTRAHRSSSLRYLSVNLAGYALNCLWVWLLVDRLGQPVELSVVPIVAVTPTFTFALNRCWTFA